MEHGSYYKMAWRLRSKEMGISTLVSLLKLLRRRPSESKFFMILKKRLENGRLSFMLSEKTCCWMQPRSQMVMNLTLKYPLEEE
jgi:hypothetical protein